MALDVTGLFVACFWNIDGIEKGDSLQTTVGRLSRPPFFFNTVTSGVRIRDPKIHTGFCKNAV